MTTHNLSTHGHPRHPLTLFAGNLIQAAGLVSGWLLLVISRVSDRCLMQVTAMIGGYLLIYFSAHAIAHFVVGRWVGIRFSHYSVGGTMHITAYPPLLRQLFAHLPFFAAHTDRESLRAAKPSARAWMYSAGMTSSVLICTLAAAYVWWTETPGGTYLLIFNAIWFVIGIITEFQKGGDYAKAIKALIKVNQNDQEKA
jgi:hypothetical protein